MVIRLTSLLLVQAWGEPLARIPSESTTLRGHLLPNEFENHLPYHGAEIVDLLRWVPGYPVITRALNLDNLREFEAAGMPEILAHLVWQKNVRWIALGAAQPTCGMLSCARAENQSWLLSLAWRFAGQEGDGVVSVASARASDLNFEPWDYVVPLEHWEVVLDREWFRALGVTNVGWIEDRQRETFAAIADRLRPR